MSTNARFGWLSGLLFVSVLLIGVSQSLQVSPVQGIVIGCAPLVYYHLRILAPQRNGVLTQVDIDSVYYFGFLVTIVSLGFGVYFFQSAGTQDVQTLLRQFAVGIMATAYAVFARMHLTSRRSRIEVVDAQSMLDQQLIHSQEILQHMMSVSMQAQALASSLSDARELVVQHFADEMSAVLGDIAHKFSQHISTAMDRLQGMTGQVESTLSAINELLVDQTMARSLRELSGAAKALGDNTMTAASASLEAATAITMVGQEFRGLQGTLSTGRDELKVVTEISTTLRQFDEAAAATAASVGLSAAELLRVATDLREVGDSVATAPRTMKRLADQVARTAEGLDFLASVAGKINVAADGLTNAAGSTERLTSALDHIVRVAPQIAVGLEQVQSGTSESARSIEQFANSVQSAGVAVSKLEAATGNIETSTRGFATIGSASNDLLRSLTALSKQVLLSQEQLAAASSQLNGTTRGASAALQQDMEAATSSAVQVSKRLVDLVNTIVEQTRRQQALRT